MADLMVGPGLAEQIRLVSWLRWRVLRHSFRNKNRRLDLIGLAVSSFFGILFVVGITVVFFIGTRSLLNHHNERFLGLLFLALFVWWQLFPILLAGFAPQFSFRSLLRFPLKFLAFYIIGMAYGLSDSAALAAVVWMLAMVAGTAAAIPAATPVMLVVCFLFTVFNVTSERLVGAWVEKLLATRRSREIFFTLFILSMVSLQFLNPLMQKYGHNLKAVVQRVLPYLWMLPSSFAGDAVARFADQQWFAALGKLAGLCAYLLVVTALLWNRYSHLYSGEELGESDAPARRPKRSPVSPADDSDSFAFVPPQVLAVFKKELRYLRRNTFLFFGLIFPPMMVLFFSVQFAGIHPTAFKKGLSPDVFFPAMMAYLVLILIAPSYNCFSYEGKGIQTYITSPVRFREVLIAKNLLTVLILFVEIVLCVALVGWRAGFPSVPVLLASLSGLVFSILGQLTIANWTSLSFPRKIEFGKMQGQRNSGMSVLVLFAVQIVFGGVGSAILFSGRWTGNPWLPTQVFAVLTIAAFAGYLAALNAFTELAESKKETLIDALCR
jgi:ABC-2 type transport system permease protein